MRQLPHLIVLLLAVAGLVLLAGCSDDDTGTNTNLAKGKLSDPVFQALNSSLYISEGYANLLMNFGYMVGDSVIGHAENPGVKGIWTESALAAASDSIFLTYHDDSQYWYLYYRHADDSETLVIEDSVQYFHGLTPVQWPDSTQWVRINMSGSLSFVEAGGEGNITVGQSVSLTRSLAAPNVILLNGSDVFDVDIRNYDHGVTCGYDLSMTGTYTNIALNFADEEECPSSGSYVYRGSAAMECTGDPGFSLEDSWTIATEYRGDSVRTTVENATTRWVFNEPCDDQGQPALRPTLRRK